MRCRRRRFHWGILSSAGAAWEPASSRLFSCQAPSSCAVSRSRRICSRISANYLTRRISTRLLTSPWAEVTRQGPMRRG